MCRSVKRELITNIWRRHKSSAYATLSGNCVPLTTIIGGLINEEGDFRLNGGVVLGYEFAWGVVEFARVMFAFTVGGAKRWRRNGRAGCLLCLTFVRQHHAVDTGIKVY